MSAAAISGKITYFITTLEEGRRLANVPAGAPVLLRIRRGARELEVALTPVPGCNAPRLTVREP